MTRSTKGRFWIVLLVLSMIVAACSGAAEEAGGDNGGTSATTEAPDAGGGDGNGDGTTDTTQAPEATTTTAQCAGEDNVLEVWGFGATGLEPGMDEWGAANGYCIETKIIGYDDHHQGLLTALAAGEVPDVAVVEVGYSSLFKGSADAGFFTNLGDIGANDLEAEFVDWRWAQGVSNTGVVFGIPTDVGGMGLAYRADLFEAAGLPSDPAGVAALWSTWEEFLDVGEEFFGAGDPHFLDDAGVLYQVIATQAEQRYYADDGSLIYDTNPNVRFAFDIATDAAERGLSANFAAFSPEWNTAMDTGEYAVQLAPSWMMGYIQSVAPNTEGLWSVTTLPVPGGNWGGSQLTIPAASDQVDAAWEMIQFVLSSDNQFAVFQNNGNFPTIEALYDTPELLGTTNPFFSDAPLGEIYAESVKNLSPIYEGIDERPILDAFGRAIDRVENGELTGEEAWEEALAEIQLDVG